MKHTLYMHRKTGKIYRLIGPARMEADMSAAAVYTDHPDCRDIWVRPHLQFFDGRFQKVGEWDDKVFDPIGDILEFHKKFDLDYPGVPRALPKDVEIFRREFLQEELDEYGWAQTAAYVQTTMPLLDRDPGEYTHQLEEALDALVDEMYVLLGTAHLHGFSSVFAEAWRRVHTANMSKVRADLDTVGKRNSTLDVVKPAGWEPPSHTDLVEDNDIHNAHLDRA